MYVQFSDSSETSITAWFGAPQDPAVYPNQGEVDESDARYVAFLEASNPTPSTESINAQRRDQLLTAAALAIAPLQDALDLGIIKPAEQALLTAWKQFRVAVNRIDLASASPTWPLAPQSGYGAVTSQPEQSA